MKVPSFIHATIAAPGKILRVAAAVLCIVCFASVGRAAETAFAPLLVAGPDGDIAGGYQLTGGDGGEFELLTLDPDSRQAFSLGRFNGLLAGVAVRGRGDYLAVTRDGALGAYGDSPESLALPDSRWTMRALVVRNGEPVVLHQDADGLVLAVPDGEQSWKILPGAIRQQATVANAVLLDHDGRLHLFWNNHSDDLSEGVIRQAVYRDSGWILRTPIAVGEAASFAVVPDATGLRLAALVPDPLGFGPPAVKSYRIVGDEWLDTLLPEAVSRLVEESFAFAATTGTGGTVWLATGPTGAEIMWPDGNRTAIRSTPDRLSQWPGWASVITLAALAILVAMYCRRSRLLSRALPGRPVDFISRGAALLADWLVVSFALVPYHIANGDIYILSSLMLSGDVMGIFWVNLAALAAYTAVGEGLFGKTPGKHFARIRVRSAGGGPATFAQAVMRNGLRIVDMFPLPIAFPGIVGLVASFLNPRRQRIGDMLAGTVVRRHLPLAERNFLLASASPRREELLAALGQPIRILTPGVDEDEIMDDADLDKPADLVMLLAQEKARSVLPGIADREIVVAADTVVVLEGNILTKPDDREDAIDMLSRLSGRSHKVYSGVAIFDPTTGQGLSDFDVTEVEFHQLSDADIAAYVDTGDPMDKAGAYGIQNSQVVKQIRGSLSNVAGLPMEKLQKILGLLDS
ncbi:MAG: Maf family nucleotide pyrophosphatase [Planctomycetes bacterium]|nr:Maf family nucleotide pyrophosphatase [Planctomycetota bacterium]